MPTLGPGRDAAASPTLRILVSRKEGDDAIHHEMVAELSEADRAFLDGFTEEQRKKVMWKLDIRLVPMLAFLYLIAYLDRANIGNAKIEGLMEDLNLSGTQYNIALSIFFVPYIILEMPSNTLLLKFKRPSHYLGTLVTLWGVVMTLTGIVKNFGGLLACRLLLGMFESGFFPGAVFTISRWYLPNEVQVRIALFYSASALAGAFSGLLAFAIAKLDGVAGVESWRWIFILEGIASVVAGGLTFFLLIDTPELSMWLTPDGTEISYASTACCARKQHASERGREVSKVGHCQVRPPGLAALPPSPRLLVQHGPQLRHEVHHAADHQEHGIYQQQSATTHYPSLCHRRHFCLCFRRLFRSIQVAHALHRWSSDAGFDLIRCPVRQG
ncbi:major facilitator superfamily transporter [Ilyonectria robusta]